MSVLKVDFSYDFHPVGQGLFASGSMKQSGGSGNPFRWVYDCGTSSPQWLVDDAIDYLEKHWDPERRIDLVTLSHFDHDHVSGIAKLASKFRIGVLMLPYMALEQRLWIAIEEDIAPADDLMRFFVNPTEYFTNRDGPGIERIVYVSPSGDEPAPASPAEPPKMPGPDGGDGWKMRLDRVAEPAGDDPALTPFNRNTQVQFLFSGGSIRLESYWEFLPYNDDPQLPIPDTFRKEVASAKDELIAGPSQSDREQALQRLKELYKNQFGGSAEQRNIISLFLLAGPVYAAWSRAVVHGFEQDPRRFNRTRRRYRVLAHNMISNRNSKSSILYTGDGYLDNHQRLARLIRFFGDKRIGQLEVLQVMHHGSETNWHKGVAAALDPSWSVFSSDPNRKQWGHPHAAVLRDFWNFGPLQVDKVHDARLDGYLSR